MNCLPPRLPQKSLLEPTAEPVVDIVATPVFELPPTAPAEEPPAEAPAPAVEEEVVAEVVEALAEVNFVITNEAGETVPLASTEAMEILADPDPVGCPSGVTPIWMGGTGVGCTTNYTSIQAAINDAMVTTGWTVYVQPGDYAENVVVSKPNITIFGNPGNLLISGADPLAPVLLGTNKTGTGFNVTAEGVTLIGFVIKGFNIGILADAASGSTTINILNNTITENATGIMNKGGTGKPGLEVHYNNFKDNDVALDNNSVETDKNNVQYVQAQNNYWGCSLGPIVYEGPGQYTIWSTKVHTTSPDPNCEVLKGITSLWDHQIKTPDYSPFKINLGPLATFCGNGIKEGAEQCDGTAGVGEHQTCTASCQLEAVPYCGDGIVNQTSEQCDGTAGVGEHQTCTASCQLEAVPYCGDGIVNQTSEQCDGTAGVGEHQTCTASCQLEAVPYCGDGIVNQTSEQCDGTAGVGEHQTCTASCQLEAVPYCGDGIVNQTSEQCDGTAGVGEHQTCTASCQLEAVPYCGDGIVNQTSEQCDGTAGVGEHQTCTASCQLEAVPYCGDGIVNQTSEQCDGTAGVGEHQTCTASCQLEAVPYCGDGIVNQTSEQCDGTAGVGEHQTCTASCQLEAVPYCGDGIVNQTSEQCDGTAGVGEHQTCTASCQLEAVPYCGDGIVNQTSEQCDGTAGVGEHQTCTASCQLEAVPYCGDGIVNQTSEQCDGTAGVGEHQTCTASCQLEAVPYCGDGIVNQTSEQCDGTAGVGEHQTCTASCQLEAVPYCGDGIVNQTSEQCDGTAGVGEHQTCTASCQLEAVPYCGDGIVNQTSEQCDGTAGVGEHQTCTASCQLEAVPYCGDGIVNQTSEQCDGTAGVGEHQTCTASCQLEAVPYCGDGKINNEEECDYNAEPTGAGAGQYCSRTCEVIDYCGDGDLDVQQGEECDDGNNTSGDGCSATCQDEPTPPPPPLTAAPLLLIPVTGQYDLITAGIGHTCALTAKNGLECWGLNDSGQVGDATFIARDEPVDVVNIDPFSVIALTSGIKHTCALTSDNQVYCWGLNSSGQLGDGTTENRNQPVQVKGLTGNIVAISAGSEFTCAQNAANEVFCWGNNATGQLNDGTEENRTTPVKATAISEVLLVSGGFMELQGITPDGAVQLWNTEPIIPVTGLPNTGNTYISADRFVTGGCSMTTASVVDCWGEIANAKVTGAIIPDMLASGAAHACTMKADGLACWGSNSHGQVGDGTLVNATEATLVKDLDLGVIALAAGAKHTCVILSDESVYCWGQNIYGQLGDGSNKDSSLPVETK